jgi:glycosyltransferase involved in cell wall biosynthesis
MSDPRELLTIAVPCLNEEENLADMLADLFLVVPNLPMDVDVVLIDDGSRDGTKHVMEQLCASYPRVRMKANPRNLGTGRSVLELYDEVDARSWFMALPGDNEIVAASILNYLPLREHYDVILGYLQNPVIRTATRRVASAAFSLMARAAYGFPYRYLNGPKLYRVSVFQGIEVIGGGHAFNAELLAKALLKQPGLRVGEAPFMARGRAMGQTKAFTSRNIARSVRDFYQGHQSVIQYREQVIARSASRGSRG